MISSSGNMQNVFLKKKKKTCKTFKYFSVEMEINKKIQVSLEKSFLYY
jgi:hypothetical protein